MGMFKGDGFLACHAGLAVRLRPPSSCLPQLRCFNKASTLCRLFPCYSDALTLTGCVEFARIAFARKDKGQLAQACAFVPAEGQLPHMRKSLDFITAACVRCCLP
eukprot:361632-Chlamydomonas_euryale.AAC.3